MLGHVLGLKYPASCGDWRNTDYELLYTVDLEKTTIESSKQVVKNLTKYARDVDTLVLWLDCDREGEAIAFDVMDVCAKGRGRQPLNFLRAHFSALTPQEINGAMQRLTPPNRNLSDAVKLRQEVDLRIGASFTRFQTLLLRDFVQGHRADGKNVLSYGPCQFPTLGFIVERYQAIQRFIPEDFWFIKLVASKMNNGRKIDCTFTWQRGHLFDRDVVEALLMNCKDAVFATV